MGALKICQGMKNKLNETVAECGKTLLIEPKSLDEFSAIYLFPNKRDYNLKKISLKTPITLKDLAGLDALIASHSEKVKAVEKKTRFDLQSRIGEYLELFNAIRERIDDPLIAIAILHEIRKDMRAEKMQQSKRYAST